VLAQSMPDQTSVMNDLMFLFVIERRRYDLRPATCDLNKPHKAGGTTKYSIKVRKKSPIIVLISLFLFGFYLFC